MGKIMGQVTNGEAVTLAAVIAGVEDPSEIYSFSLIVAVKCEHDHHPGKYRLGVITNVEDSQDLINLHSVAVSTILGGGAQFIERT